MAKPGTVYVVKPKFKDGPYKIGYTTRDLAQRLQALQTGSYEELEVVAVINSDDPKALELSIHRQFREEWIGGEWFCASKRLYSFLMSQPGIYSPIGKALRRMNAIPNRSWHAATMQPEISPQLDPSGLERAQLLS